MTNLSPETILTHLQKAFPGDWEHVEGQMYTLDLMKCWVATEIEILEVHDDEGTTWYAKVLNGSEELFSHSASTAFEAICGLTPYMDLLQEMDHRVQRMQETRTIQLDDNERVETGPVRFIQENGYQDWTGIFIRGDGALYYSFMLSTLLDEIERLDMSNEDYEPYPIYVWQIRSLMRMLSSCGE
jgi:hypothetical protein